MARPKDKYAKVNVPELFVQRFILEDNRSGTSLTDKLRAATPTSRGRGLTRIIENLTYTEWEELYQLAAHGRAQMIGADRESTLRPAICARALAERMEKLGVDNPIAYTPKRKKTTSTAPTQPVAPAAQDDDDEDDTDLSSTVSVPQTPPTVNRANDDVSEVDDDELDDFSDDMAIGN